MVEAQLVRRALKRFQEVLDYLSCECDSYNGFTCTIHEDKETLKIAFSELKMLEQRLNKKLEEFK